MERGVTEELVELFKKKNVDFMSLSQLKSALSAALRKRLGLTTNSKGPQIEKALLPYLGDALNIKKGSRSKYLTFKQPDEVLLFRIIQKSEGKAPGADKIPFTKDAYLVLINRLLEQGMVRVRLNKDYKPLLYPAKELPEPSVVSEEKFIAAYQALERGNFYVRICDMRRALDWSVQEFDAMLVKFRDAGKIQLQTGEAEFFTEADIRDSFRDENGFSKLTMKWRQR